MTKTVSGGLASPFWKGETHELSPGRVHGIPYQRLTASTAFHSEIVSDCVAQFKAVLDKITLSGAKGAVYANSSAKPYPRQVTAIKKTLAEQIAKPVKFAAQITQMQQDGANIFVEVGPGKVLAGLLKKILPKDYPCQIFNVNSMKELERFLKEIA